MALNEPLDPDELPCGRPLMEVWEDWDEGRAERDPHYARCPHCTAALAEMRALGAFVEQSRAAPPGPREMPDARAVTARVMDIVRLELRPGRTLPLGEPDEDAWIVEAAAAKTFRAAAESLPGVRAGSCRVTPGDPRAAGRGAAVLVRLEVAAGPDWTVPRLADAVRERVARAAREAIGLAVSAIDIVVVDILEPEDGVWPALAREPEESGGPARPGAPGERRGAAGTDEGGSR
ncbi:Asp23/Gls24 family envelope stress response protein [Streptomyces marincola]|uniref:Asp23/Gls24 family envelope stress response protein n=1 Tax=Streptomyces marincola TaxID=2878388 RepID=UPI000D1AB18C|nr:Asp23/Gls24 family envelope stress response protein [Streptomyces marincola]